MAYPTITPLPPAPQRGEDFTTFSQKANDFVAAQSAFVTEVNAAGDYIDTKAAEVEQDAVEAADSANAAAASEATVLASANFKGEWSSLTGSLDVPSSVYHDGAYWQLLNDLPDVTVSEPGVTVDWASANSSEFWTPLASSSTLGANRRYAIDFTTGPLTLTLPPSPSTNDYVQWYKSDGESVDSVIDPGAESIMGTPAGEVLNIDFEATALHLVYSGSDWRVVR